MGFSTPWPRGRVIASAAATAPTLVLQEAMDQGLLVQPIPDVYVLGTVHAGNQSAIEVSCLLETVQPRTVVLEVSPSRLALLRRRNRLQQKRTQITAKPEDTSCSSMLSLGQALTTWPALWVQGWEKGGWAAAFFGIAMVWPAMVSTAWQNQRSQSGESSSLPPRVDEFATAVRVVEDSLHKNVTVVAADVEMDEVWQRVGAALARPDDGLALIQRLLGEAIGVYDKDPLSRRPNESYQHWYSRRRQPATALASKQHGMERSPALADVLVDQRDEAMTDALLHHIDKTPLVCVVGLVHLDGVVQALLRENNATS